MTIDSGSTQQMPVYVPPQIQIEPEELTFGAYNPNLPLIQQPMIQMTIRNIGGATLIGRLVPQVSWLIVNPPLFKLKGGESSNHMIQISTGAPQQLNQKDHFFAHAMVVTSNAGPSGLDVSYTLDFEQRSYSSMKIDLRSHNRDGFGSKFLPVVIVILFLLLSILGARALFFPQTQSELALVSREELLTQGAQTIMASSDLATATKEPDAAIVRQTTPTTLSLFDPLQTDTPDLTATAFEPTYTPWVADEFESPETLVTRYFSLLIEADYQTAWEMLSREYQAECCNAIGTDPYYIFSRDWSAVTDITLVSAYLQEYDMNPAPVLVRFQYRNSDDELQEFTHMYWVAVDEDQTGLIIEDIDPLQSN